MTGTWTDPELDAALRDLADVLDPDPADATLAAVRSRLTGAAIVPPAVDVLDLGPARDARPPRRRWAPALLVAAALVAAVTLAAVFWPHAARRTPPAAQPTPTAARDVVAFRQGLLMEPVLETATSVLLSIAGVGDTTISLPSVPADGPTVTIAYGFVCGDPRFGGDPNGPDNDVSEYELTDNLGTTSGGSCAPVRDGVGVASFGTGPDLDPRGRARLRVDVPTEDTVWKLAVAATTR